MSGRINPRDAGSVGIDGQTVVLLGVLGLIISIAVTVQLALVCAAQFGVDQEIPSNPASTVVALARGELVWTMGATVTAIILWIVVGVIVFGLSKAILKRKKTAIDQASRYLASSREIAELEHKAVQKVAERLIRRDLVNDYPGLRFGVTMGGKPLFGTWEDLFVVIYGSRSGKTSSVVIPAIVEAPGVVVTTSNKPDVVLSTMNFRKTKGQVWVFDPQDIAVSVDGLEPWMFDPLDMVRRDPNDMDSAAKGLADIFLAGSRDPEGKSDAYFEAKGSGLLSQFFLAAALDNRPITDVFSWVGDDNDRTAIAILEGHPQWAYLADDLRGTYNVTEKTRSGIFSQAQQMAECLGRFSARKWITPSDRRRFSPAEFVRSSGDTMYLLSEDTKGASVSPLTTALVAAIMQEAERYAIECGGRLPVPLVAPLDEAANVVRWPDLPKLYSHYGSRGIILMTILQTYSQGVNMWGKVAMETLWSSASLALVGPGVRDDEFLRTVENLIGEIEVWEKSTSSGRDYHSVSRQLRSKKILTVADLAAMPLGRVVLLPAKRRPAIITCEPWWERPWPKEIKALLGKQQYLPGEREDEKQHDN